MDVAHAILFAKKIDISGVTEAYLSSNFPYNKKEIFSWMSKKGIRIFEEVDAGVEGR